MITQPRELSVTVPFGQALERVKTVLFQPFDLAKWFVIGFCAWLAYLGQGGGGNFASWHGRGEHSLREAFDHARDYVMHNLGWILPLSIGLVLAGMTIWLLVLWLSSRGRFMFLHCVALNRAEVALPWHKFAREGNSLFLFRLVLSLIGLLLVLPMVGGLAFTVLRMVFRESVSAGGIVVAGALLLALIIVSIVFWIIGRLVDDFVVPIQFLRGSRCVTGWRELRGLLPGNMGHFILYLLFRIALAIGIAAALVLLVLITCCIAGCLLALPYLGTVLLLPVLVLERSFSIYFLAQFGAAYDALQTTAPPGPATA